MTHEVKALTPNVHVEPPKDPNINSSFLRRNLTARNVCYATIALALLATVTFVPQVQVAIALTLQITQTLSTLLTNILIVGGYMAVMCGKAAVSTVGGLLAGMKGLFGSGSQSQISSAVEQSAGGAITGAQEMVDSFVAQQAAQSDAAAEMVEAFAEEQAALQPRTPAVEKMVEAFTKEETPPVQPKTPEMKPLHQPQRAAVRAMVRDYQATQKPAETMAQEFVMATVWNAIEKEMNIAASSSHGKPFDQVWDELWTKVGKQTEALANQPIHEGSLRAKFLSKVKDQFDRLEKAISLSKHFEGAASKGLPLKVEQQQLVKARPTLEEQIKAPLFEIFFARARV